MVWPFQFSASIKSISYRTGSCSLFLLFSTSSAFNPCAAVCTGAEAPAHGHARSNAPVSILVAYRSHITFTDLYSLWEVFVKSGQFSMESVGRYVNSLIKEDAV